MSCASCFRQENASRQIDVAFVLVLLNVDISVQNVSVNHMVPADAPWMLHVHLVPTMVQRVGASEGRSDRNSQCMRIQPMRHQ